MLSFSLASPLFVLLVVCFSCIPVQADSSLEAEHPRRSFGKRDAFSDSGLSLASWIWLPEPDLLTTAPTGDVAFIKTLVSPPGNIAVSAQITITVDNNYTLWVNGQPVGASDGGESEWEGAQVFSAALNATANVFSVLGNNAVNVAAPSADNPAGLLAAINILYNNNHTQLILSDNTWLVSATVPADFPLPADLSAFVPAEIATKYGSGPWATNVTVPSPDPNPLDLTGSAWIWSTSNATINAPVGKVGFRKTVVSPSDKTAASATVILSVDNSFDLYVNGQYIGSPPFDNNALNSVNSWSFAQRFTVTLAPSTNVFTVVATNFPPEQGTETSGAGLIAAVLIKYTDGSSDLVRTDATWLTGSLALVSLFLSMSDSKLAPSILQGAYGVSPWGQIGISDALNVLKLPANNAAVAPAPPSTTNTHPTPATTPTSSNSSTSSPGTGSARANLDDRIAPILVFALSIVTFF
ncbi:hypothetical protein B0H19DRAFT_1250377 [Mycena capillaripes]|nr:hypothetical protein B0H19DRAFT_1250377 [Mycena capillaripes]